MGFLEGHDSNLVRDFSGVSSEPENFFFRNQNETFFLSRIGPETKNLETDEAEKFKLLSKRQNLEVEKFGSICWSQKKNLFEAFYLNLGYLHLPRIQT